MKKVENYLKEALLWAGVEKLPKKENVAFEGLAIVKVRKGKREMYGVGKYDRKLKRPTLSKDFNTRAMVDEVLAWYPCNELPENDADEPTDAIAEMKVKLTEMGYPKAKIRMWGIPRCTAELENIEAIKGKLTEAGISDLDGTLEELELRLEDSED